MDCRVLSVQSHVVRGYVGNKSASFPLQVRLSSFCSALDACSHLKFKVDVMQSTTDCFTSCILKINLLPEPLQNNIDGSFPSTMHVSMYLCFTCVTARCWALKSTLSILCSSPIIQVNTCCCQENKNNKPNTKKF